VVIVIKVTYLVKLIESSNSINVSVEECTQCPICKKSIKPLHLNSVYFPITSNNLMMESHLLCKGCNQSFIAHYEISRRLLDGSSYFSGDTASYLAPNEFIKTEYDQFISDTSPTFIEIYNQASAAESYNLHQIAGIGYRKALEFLIKDYLIKTNPPEDEEAIKKMLLGKCISEKIDSEQLKIAASRATWLGNDQTHYVQKFDDKDINDLKRLIRLTVHWISMILETKEAELMEPR
jgi:hypothetical protein